MTETLTSPAASPATRQLLFRGLNYYTEAEAALFFGRDKETQQLYQLIKYNVLTLVFGKSGTGKTSLLNAGVFPLLREDDCLPFPIRLKFGEGSPSLKEQVVQVLTSKIEQDGFTISSFNPSDTLWEFFHREDLWKVITPVLIFDQFEEIFTLLAAQSPKTAELTALFTELSDLIENTIPEQIKAAYLRSSEAIPFNYKRQRAKVIFAFREDFLPEMESITSFIPSVKNSRFRLLPMTARQAYDVITKTWQSAIQAAEARDVVYYLTNNEGSGEKELPFQLDTMALFEIEPSLLSQVCSYLETKRAEENLSKISAEFLQKYSKETILRSIYYDALEAGAAANTTAANEPTAGSKEQLQVFLEKHLINEEGYRIKYDKKEVAPALLPGIYGLKSRYFIREEEDSLELSHDVIANIVKADRDERRRTIAEAEAKNRARTRAKVILVGAGLIALMIAVAAYLYVDSAKTDAKNAEQRANSAVQRADSAKQQVDSANLQLANVIDSIQSLRNQNTLGNSMDTARYIYLIDSLSRVNNDLDSFLYDAQIQVTSLNKKIATYTSSQKEMEFAHVSSQSELEGLRRRKGELNYKMGLFNSLQTHLDSIFYSKEVKNTPELYYHVGVLRVNYDSFKVKLSRGGQL